MRKPSVVSGLLGSTTPLVLIWATSIIGAPYASAATCTTSTPAIGEQVTCSNVGGATTTITVPSGATNISLTIDGAGGGGGGSDLGSNYVGAAGGAGARVVAEFDVAGLSAVTVTIGDSGTRGDPEYGGGGGGYSAVFRGSDPNDRDSVLVVAGGGGGGGALFTSTSGGSGGSSGTAAGGDGRTGTSGGRGASGDGTGGASGGLGGGEVGESWAAGGAGGAPGNSPGGSGGGGYGGGGGADTGAFGGGAGGSFASSQFLIGNAVFSSGGAAGGSGSTIAPGFGVSGSPGALTFTFTIRALPTPSQGTAEPVLVTLRFLLPLGMHCDFGSVEASQGAWIQLPGAQDCAISPRADGTTPTLLGWATDADFPVDVAQRQVDRSWGAYETFNDDGQLTSVFIPAGGSTAVTAPTALHPVLG